MLKAFNVVVFYFNVFISSFFLATGNGIVLIIYFSMCLSLVCRSVTGFCKLILLSVILWKMIISSVNFLVEHLWSLIWRIISSAHRNIFTTSILICASFISLSYLTILAKTSRSILNMTMEIN